jgi:hypothetical protein
MRLLLLTALLLPLSAQETMIRQVFDPKTDTHVEVLALFTQPSRGGFFPVRVKVANNLGSDQSIRLDFKSSASYDSRIVTRSSYAIEAPVGKAVTRDLIVPLNPGPAAHADALNLEAELSGSLGKAKNTIRVTTGTGSPCVLLSESLFTVNASSLDAEISKKGGSSGYGNHTFAAGFDPKQLPNDWLAFSGYDSLLMTAADWSNTPAGSRNAIISWMMLGGQLVIFSDSQPSLASLGLPADPGFGTCLLRPLSSDLKLLPKETLELVSNVNPVRQRNAAINQDFDGSWPLQKHFGSQEFHYAVFIAVLILFGILVGPINLFVLAKSGRRHRLFITTPLISLGASLVLVGLIIFQDGFGGNGMRRVLMEVRPDAGQNAALLHQEQITRTGILTGNRLTIDPACLFSPAPIAKSRWSRYTDDYQTRGSFNLQPAGGKMEASGDWFQSRSEHGHALTAVVATRGRIERTADPMVFVSTFDFPLETLYFLDESKQWHRAESIQTGKAFTLTPIDASMAEPALAEEINAFTTRNRELLGRAKNRSGHFVALTGKAPGIDTHRGIRWKETRTVITGPLANP